MSDKVKDYVPKYLREVVEIYNIQKAQKHINPFSFWRID